MRDTVRIGAITETKAILKFLELGYNVFTPYSDGSKCDLIIQKENRLYKVQCKTARLQRKKVIFNAYSTARIRSLFGVKGKIRYTAEDIDFYCTFDLEDNMYLIPIESVTTLSPDLRNFTIYIVE